MKPAKLYLPGSSRIIPDHAGYIKYLFHPGSNAGCSRIIPDVAGRVTDVPRLFPVVPRSFQDHPGRLPGLCRDIIETVALSIKRLLVDVYQIFSNKNPGVKYDPAGVGVIFYFQFLYSGERFQGHHGGFVRFNIYLLEHIVKWSKMSFCDPLLP
jgi:hypothetical protein